MKSQQWHSKFRLFGFFTTQGMSNPYRQTILNEHELKVQITNHSSKMQHLFSLWFKVAIGNWNIKKMSKMVISIFLRHKKNTRDLNRNNLDSSCQCRKIELIYNRHKFLMLLPNVFNPVLEYGAWLYFWQIFPE